MIVNESFSIVWSRWVASWSFQDGMLFIPIDVYFFFLLSSSFVLAAVVLSTFHSLFLRKSIKGKLALVTGAAQGIGRELSFHLANNGVRLILWDINEEQLKKTANDINAKHPNLEIHTHACDVSSLSDVTRAAEETTRNLTAGDFVEILINNAGVVSGKPFDNLTERDIQRTLGVNTFAHFWTLKAFLPAMKRHNRGHIVTIASTCGIFSAASLADYCASKFAVIGFHDCIRLELRKERKHGVKMTLVCPNTTNTGMFEGVDQGFQWLFPILTPQFVASSVVNAIKDHEDVVYLPRSLKLGIFLLPTLPTRVKDFVMDFAGVSNAMDTFRGRQNQ